MMGVGVGNSSIGFCHEELSIVQGFSLEDPLTDEVEGVHGDFAPRVFY